MNLASPPRRAVAAAVVFGLLNPLPYGFFVAALIFDAVYTRSGEPLWIKGAAWLITFGLLFAVIPRLIDLAWRVTGDRRRPLARDGIDFGLQLLAIVAAIVNAFVHSRDAYTVVPLGLWLSACTVLMLSLGQAWLAARPLPNGELLHA